MFKKMRGCRLAYDAQGYIYFKCKCFSYLSKAEQTQIISLCKGVAHEYAEALFCVLTSQHGVRWAAMEYAVSERTLYSLRLRFFNVYWERVMSNCRRGKK